MKRASFKEIVFSEIRKALENYPDGLSYTELYKLISSKIKDVHPKTLNGYLWKFTLAVKNGELKDFEFSEGKYRKSKID